MSAYCGMGKMPRVNRWHRTGGCQDCGRNPVREISFISTGMRYAVCAEHEREYCGRRLSATRHSEKNRSAVVVDWNGREAI